MRLLTRREAVPALWQPDGAGVQAVSPAEVDDQGCDTDPYRVGFSLPGTPGAAITLWLYATRGADATATFGWRYQWSPRVPPRWRHQGIPWSHAGYGYHWYLYATLVAADTAAWGAATVLAGGGWLWRVDLSEVFGWDGQPW
jgi:hypothetical protein